MKNTLRAISFILCTVLALMTSACKKKAPSPEDEIIYYSITFEPDSLDPQIAEDSSSRLIVMNIFEGLVRLDENNTPVPGAAVGWKVSEDGTIITFDLRENSFWSNGQPLTPEDFLFGIQRSLDPRTGCKSASVLYSIKNAEAVNKGEVRQEKLGVYVTGNRIIFELARPDADFISNLALPCAMPCNREYFESTGGQYGRDSDKIISNGPFYIRSSGWSHDEYINLRRNPEYTGLHTAVPAGVNITVSDAPESVCAAIKEGTLDCYTLPGSELAQAKKQKLHLTSFGETVWGISFNTTNEVLQYEDIRHALLASLDRSYILKNIPDGCTSTLDIIPESVKTDGYSYRSHAPSGLCIPYSKNARSELETAMKKHKLDELPKLTILCTNDGPTQKIVNNIIETWNSLTGTYVNKEPVSQDELNDCILSGEFRVVIAPLVAEGDSPLNTLELFSSGSSYNTAALSDEKYDGMIAAIRTASDSDSLLRMIEAEEYLNDKGIFYPLYNESRYYASAPDVTGMIFHPYGMGIDFSAARKEPSGE